LALPRAYGRIQKQRRIAVPKDLMEILGWKIEDQVLVEVYKGKLIVENISKSLRPLEERIS